MMFTYPWVKRLLKSALAHSGFVIKLVHVVARFPVAGTTVVITNPPPLADKPAKCDAKRYALSRNQRKNRNILRSGHYNLSFFRFSMNNNVPAALQVFRALSTASRNRNPKRHLKYTKQ